jgi:hypothetical protein
MASGGARPPQAESLGREPGDAEAGPWTGIVAIAPAARLTSMRCGGAGEPVGIDAGADDSMRCATASPRRDGINVGAPPISGASVNGDEALADPPPWPGVGNGSMARCTDTARTIGIVAAPGSFGDVSADGRDGTDTAGPATGMSIGAYGVAGVAGVGVGGTAAR